MQMDRRGRREQGNPSILRRVGMRQLPGICQYSAKGPVLTGKQGGTASSTRPWQIFVGDGFLFFSDTTVRALIYILRRNKHMIKEAIVKIVDKQDLTYEEA